MHLTKYVSYLIDEKGFTKHTVVAYARDILSFVNFCESKGIQDIDEIEYKIIRSWIAHLLKDGLANTSVNRKISSIHHYYKFLMIIGARDSDPLISHTFLKKPKRQAIPFSHEEMSQVLDEVEFPDTFNGVRDRLIIELLYATGIRNGELVELKCADIDFVSGIIKVIGKGNKERLIPMLPGLDRSILAYLQKRKKIARKDSGDFLILSSRGNKSYEVLVYRTIKQYFSDISSKVKISPHVLRHTFASHLLNEGANINAVKELLGHSSLAATQVYTHANIEELRKVYLNTHPRSKIDR